MGTHVHTQVYMNTDTDKHIRAHTCVHTQHTHKLSTFANTHVLTHIYKGNTHTHTHARIFIHPHILFLLVSVILSGRKGLKGQPWGRDLFNRNRPRSL